MMRMMMSAKADSAGVAVQAFRFRHTFDRWPKVVEPIGRDMLKGDFFYEAINRDARPGSRNAIGWQGVIGSGRIVAG